MKGHFEIPFAVDEQGRACVWPVGKGHLLATGTTGAGKSSIPRAVICHAALSTLVQPIGIDLKQVELSLYRGRLSALATERDEAADVLGQVVGIMQSRKVLAARHGLTSWPASARHPYLMVVVDELAELTAADGLGRAAQRAAETCSGHLDRIGRLGRALGVGLLAATQRAEASIVGGSLRSLFAYRFALASLDLSSYRMALGLSEGVDLNHLTAGLSIDRPGCGLWLDPGHPTIRVARVCWWNDVLVLNTIRAASRFTVPLEELAEWAASAAGVLAVAG